MSMLAGLLASYMNRSQGRPRLAYHKRLPLRHPLGGYQRPSVVEIQLERDQMEIKKLHLPSVPEYLAKPVWMMNMTLLAKVDFFPWKVKMDQGSSSYYPIISTKCWLSWVPTILKLYRGKKHISIWRPDSAVFTISTTPTPVQTLVEPSLSSFQNSANYSQLLHFQHWVTATTNQTGTVYFQE